VRQLRKRLTYANVMATIALFVALGGASYAAIKLPKNSVGSKQIKKNSITAAKIKNGAVTGAKIQAGSLGTVPNATSAATAARATSAANADALGGLAPGAFAASSQIATGGVRITGPAQQILSIPGLTVSTKQNSFDEVRLKAAPGTDWALNSTSTPAFLQGGEYADFGIPGYIETIFVKGLTPPSYWVITCSATFFSESVDCVAVGK